ncbi:MAG: hypothetical protein GX580_06795 [Candidatus Hydrogenedens sp.]|nr:hypothetical protein [Candidatus Hydrogenedens sp.]
MNTRRHAAVLAALLLAFAGAAQAHRYVPDDGSHTGPAAALEIADVTLSQVAYHPVTEATRELWLTFEGNEGQLFYFQLGVPFLERLADYRPALALIGPGLPDGAAPFDIPEGLVVQIYDSAELTPVFFDEPFTGTQSWIMFEHEIPLPADGRYYLVAYVPDGRDGKLWTAVGRREDWGFRDILTLHRVIKDVRVFHEVEKKPKPLFTWVISSVSLVLDTLFFWVK